MNLLRPDEIDFASYMRETEAQTKVKGAEVYIDEMIDRLGKPDDEDRGAFLPWRKTHDLLRFRPGEVTLWAGINGHGKSLVQGLAATSIVAQNEKVCIASFEMKPRKTLHRMARQFLGMNDSGEWAREPDAIDALKDLYEQFRDLCKTRLWIYDQQGSVDTPTIIGVARYCAKELGIKHIFIDSLMKCVRGEDDHNGQKMFMDEMTAIARDYESHIHVVHHMKKLGAETDLPDKFSVKGTGAITDLIDNLLIVWRNKAKEDDVQAGKKVDFNNPDTIVFCRKQRNGTGWEGPMKLWFDADSMRFTAEPKGQLDMCAWPHD